MPMISHAQARDVVKQAWAQYDPHTPLGLGTAQLIQGTGYGEGEYGWAWNNAHNWGAVQPASDKGEGCPAGTTPGSDSTPMGGTYVACLKVYPDDVAGCLDMIRWIVKASDKDGKAALYAGDNQRLAASMYHGHYYLGFHPNAKEKAAGMSKADADAANIHDRVAWIQRMAQAGAKALGEALAIDGSAPSGSSGGGSGGSAVPVAGAALVGAGILVGGYFLLKGR